MTAGERTPLDAEIRRRIARDGPMTIAKYMALCLYDSEHGYYHHRAPFGAAGDFVTAPEISQMFGELIGLWAATVWRAMGEPHPIHLVELGPGRGTMMSDALRALRTVPAFSKAVRVHLVEIEPRLTDAPARGACRHHRCNAALARQPGGGARRTRHHPRQRVLRRAADPPGGTPADRLA